MGLLLVTVFLVIIFTSLATDCPPGEYKNEDLCCPMCHIGTVVKSHCTSTSSSNVCIPCVKGTYMDHPNGVTKCLKCTECDTGGGLVEIKECTYTSNAVCDCKPGYYCSGQKDSCDLCQPHSICKVGQYIKVQGTSKTDYVCEDCSPGHFSTEKMSKNCTAWTACTEQGRHMSSQGTSTSDSVCVDGRHHYMIIVSILIVFIILFIYRRNCRKVLCYNLKPARFRRFLQYTCRCNRRRRIFVRAQLFHFEKNHAVTGGGDVMPVAESESTAPEGRGVKMDTSPPARGDISDIAGFGFRKANGAE